MTEYVAGFLFDQTLTRVALIKKKRPDWQAGKLNAIGGHVEPNESFARAMVREFFEETGVQIEGWRPTCSLQGSDWRVHFYMYADERINSLKSMTDEEVIISPAFPHQLNRISNLRWLIPMAVYCLIVSDDGFCHRFNIEEFSVEP